RAWVLRHTTAAGCVALHSIVSTIPSVVQAAGIPQYRGSPSPAGAARRSPAPFRRGRPTMVSCPGSIRATSDAGSGAGPSVARAAPTRRRQQKGAAGVGRFLLDPRAGVRDDSLAAAG